jgi:hypothetical protein
VLIAAFSILGFAALLGSALAVLHLRAQSGAASPVKSSPTKSWSVSWPVSWPVAALHGLLGIGGLICLVLALRGPPRGLAQDTASFGAIAAGFFTLAALAGGGILAMHLRKRRRAGALIGLHAALAVSGFVILAAYLLAG